VKSKSIARFLLLMVAVLGLTARGHGQDADYSQAMNEALAEASALRSTGRLPGVPPDSQGGLMLKNLPPFSSKLVFPVSITLEVQIPGSPAPLSFFLTRDDPTGRWRLTDTPAVKEPALRAELLQMREQDQEIRTAPAARNPDAAYLARWAAIDEANTARLKAIVAQHGWPGAAMVGDDGARAAFLIVQHADRDRAFQREMLPLLQAASEAGQVSRQEYAYLVDRVRVGEGKPQLYGSQSQQAPDGTKWIPWPIEDETHVDERRRAVGLGPLADYFILLNQLNPLTPK
jgi:hypothetical protein